MSVIHATPPYPQAALDTEAEAALRTRESAIAKKRKRLSMDLKNLQAKADRLRSKLDESGPSVEITADLEEAMLDIDWIQYGIYQLVAEALAITLDGGTIETYTPAEIKAWCDRAVAMGAPHPRFDPEQLRSLVRLEQVPNAPFREAYKASGLNAGDVADRLTAITGRQVRASEVERLLGIKPTVRGGDRADDPPTVQLFIKYEQGVAFASTLGIPPHKVGV